MLYERAKIAFGVSFLFVFSMSSIQPAQSSIQIYRISIVGLIKQTFANKICHFNYYRNILLLLLLYLFTLEFNFIRTSVQ